MIYGGVKKKTDIGMASLKYFEKGSVLEIRYNTTLLVNIKNKTKTAGVYELSGQPSYINTYL